jgi:DNA-binding NarL/FixJ family response regulator
MVHIAIIEDNLSLASSLSQFLNDQEAFTCTLVFGSLEEFRKSPETALDIVLLDIDLGEEETSLGHIEEVKRRAGKNAKVIMVTGTNSEEYLKKSLTHGADGYFLKGNPLHHLLDCIWAVHKGGTYFSMAAANLLKQSFREKNLVQTTLSEREKEIANLLIEGLTYEEVSKKIFVSVNTVRHYVKSMYKKLDVNNKTQLRKKLVP